MNQRAVPPRSDRDTPPPVDLDGNSQQAVEEDLLFEDDDQLIEAVEFQPQAAVEKRPQRKTPGWIRGVLSLILLVGGFAVWFMFTARPIAIEVRPGPESMDVPDAGLSYKLGGRWMLLPGEYTVTASKEGYYDLEETFEVSAESSDQQVFDLNPLPGLISLTTDPDVQAAVYLGETFLGTTPLADAEVVPGDHVFRVEAERFMPFSTELSVEGRNVKQALVANLTPMWANIDFASTPEGATILVDGEAVGETPLTAEILEGRRDVEVAKAGFKSWQRELNVVANEPQTFPAIKLAPADGSLSIRSLPAGASVTVNGQYRGQTPLNLKLQPGREHELAISKAGYQRDSRNVRIRSDQDQSVVVTLQANLGDLAITAFPADAELFIDGEPRGRAHNQRLQLTAVPHKIEIRKEGYAPYETTVTPRVGFEQAIEARLLTFEEARYAALPEVIRVGRDYDMRLVRPGTFKLGSPRREQGRRSNEIEYRAEITRPFYIGTTEVTNAQIKRWRAEHDSGVAGRHSLDINTHPAVRVSWNDAARYCNWLSQQAGLPAAYVANGSGDMVAASPMTHGFRLPTEAEWVWSVRYSGGFTRVRKYPWGERMPPTTESGNYAGAEIVELSKQAISAYEDGFVASSPVASFEANALGLYDGGGNVAEWIHDYYGITRVTPGQDIVDPMGPAQGEQHVIRGSSWNSGTMTQLRLAYRDGGIEGREDVGFRVARFAEPEK